MSPIKTFGNVVLFPFGEVLILNQEISFEFIIANKYSVGNSDIFMQEIIPGS